MDALTRQIIYFRSHGTFFFSRANYPILYVNSSKIIGLIRCQCVCVCDEIFKSHRTCLALSDRDNWECSSPCKFVINYTKRKIFYATDSVIQWDLFSPAFSFGCSVGVDEYLPENPFTNRLSWLALIFVITARKTGMHKKANFVYSPVCAAMYGCIPLNEWLSKAVNGSCIFSLYATHTKILC